MTSPTGVASTAPGDAPHAYVDQSAAYGDAGAATDAADASGARAANASGAAGQAGIEKDVGTILAGLNQEQLESIVAAARATDGDQHGYGQSQYDASLAHLPPGLGQAASALTSFASSFKRTSAPGIPTDEELANGAGAHLGDAPPPPGMEHDLQHQRQLHGQAHKGAADPAHDPAATAAALAAMGTLAGRQLPTHHSHAQVHGLGEHDAAAMGDSSMDAKYVGEHGLSNAARYKRKGPELDRQRKDNHKEVERRRRSAINDGIVQLSQIVPGCDVKNTNKGSIIIAAVRYIQDLKNNEASNIEKWTLEKLLMDQAMNDLSMSLDESRREVERLRAQLGMAEAAQGGDKSAAPATHAHYADQRYGNAQPAFNGDGGEHTEQGLGVLDQGHVANGDAALDHANMLNGLDSDAAKRARLV